MVFSNLLVAMSVSVNYSDVLRFTLQSNARYFDKWFIVTSRTDLETQKTCALYPNVEVIFFNFSNQHTIFNKGGAIRKVQKIVHQRYPHSWYLIVDADICLDKWFGIFKTRLKNLNQDYLYGAKWRRDYASLSSFYNRKNYKQYPNENQIHGYFQLYRRHILYQNSYDASWCDLEFGKHFETHKLLRSFRCHHLGERGNWDGKKGTRFSLE